MAKRSRADVRHAIDLLWTHQIRRENVQLYKEVQQMQGVIKHFTEEQDKIRETARNAETTAAEAVATVTPTLSSIQTLRAKLEITTTLAEATSKQISDLPSHIERVQKDWQSSIDDLDHRIDHNRASVQQLQAEHDEAVTSLKAKFDKTSRALESKIEEQSLEDLHLRIQALENSFSQYPSDVAVLSHISESIAPADIRYEANVADTRCGAGEQNSECDTATEEEEYMLTMRDLETRDTTSDEFDLDANVAVPSYALHAYRPSPIRDFLQPIAPASSSNAQLRAEILALKQGRYHSHDRYLAEGQSLMDRIPKEQERFLVENFVKGLYSAGEREQCHQLLQLRGWRWEAIVSFLSPGTPSVRTHMYVDKVPEDVEIVHSPHRGKTSDQEKPANLQIEVKDAARLRKEDSAPGLLRRSTRIAASQHPYRNTVHQAHENQLDATREVGERQDQLENSAADPRKREPLRQRTLLAASSIRKPASVVSVELGNNDHSHSPSQSGGASSMIVNSMNKKVSNKERTATTPERSIRAVAVAGRRTQRRATQKKRKGPDDWLRTESESNDSTASDDIHLPSNLSLELVGRKKRRRTHRHARAVACPPPEIPILSTSE